MQSQLYAVGYIVASSKISKFRIQKDFTPNFFVCDTHINQANKRKKYNFITFEYVIKQPKMGAGSEIITTEIMEQKKYFKESLLVKVYIYIHIYMYIYIYIYIYIHDKLKYFLAMNLYMYIN